jgi:hypothetical protein
MLLFTGIAASVSGQLFCTYTIQPVPDNGNEQKYKHQFTRLHAGLAR